MRVLELRQLAIAFSESFQVLLSITYLKAGLTIEAARNCMDSRPAGCAALHVTNLFACWTIGVLIELRPSVARVSIVQFKIKLRGLNSKLLSLLSQSIQARVLLQSLVGVSIEKLVQ